MLVQHPRVLYKIREEIGSVTVANGNLQRDDIKRMTYLGNVLKEGMSIVQSTCSSWATSHATPLHARAWENCPPKAV